MNQTARQRVTDAPKPSAGRPSKLEERAFAAYVHLANLPHALQSELTKRRNFETAVKQAEDFAALWDERQRKIREGEDGR